MTPRKMITTALLASLLLLAAAIGCAGQEVGLDGGALRPCPGSPNCVSSEEGAPEGARVAPLDIPAGTSPAAAFEALAAVVGERASLEVVEPEYLHAVFKTRLLRFRDDFEARLDAAAGVIHVRSASRLGYSDLGANRRRVEAVREAFRTALD